MTKNRNFQYNFNIQEAQLNDCFQLSKLHLYCLPFDPGSVLGFTFLSKTLYLEEGDQIRVRADSNNRLHFISSFEEIT